jgi:hypothetical protein
MQSTDVPKNDTLCIIFIRWHPTTVFMIVSEHIRIRGCARRWVLGDSRRVADRMKSMEACQQVGATMSANHERGDNAGTEVHNLT